MITKLTSLVIGSSFSFNLFNDIHNMWQFDFMRHAFESGTIVAVVAGVVGYFVVIRRSSFAAHALSHIGFAGAAGAVLLGLSPLLGLMIFTSGGGITMALLGKRKVSRDVQIGTVLAFMLGLGTLFISLYKGYASEAYSILFGEILGVSASDVVITLISGVIVLLAVILLFRLFLFTSLDEDVAEAKGIPVLLLGIIFMIILAIATSIAVEVVGVLLIFSLTVTPAAVGARLSKKPLNGIIISVVVALLATWIGLFIAFYQPYPVSFFITTIVFIVYLLTRLIPNIKFNGGGHNELLQDRDGV